MNASVPISTAGVFLLAAGGLLVAVVAAALHRGWIRLPRRKGEGIVTQALKASVPPAVLFLGWLAGMALLASTEETPAAAPWQELGVSGLAILTAWWCFRILRVLADRLEKSSRRRKASVRGLVSFLVVRVLRAVVITLLVLFLALSLPFPFLTPLADELTIATAILTFGLAALRLVADSEMFFLSSLAGAAQSPMDKRSALTRIKLLKQIARVVVALLTAASFMMVFDEVRALGGSLLASAGVAGIVLGLAAQRTFASIFAGIQIGLTQPIRIGDFVKIDHEMGTVEEISLTFVVVRLWDLRRLVLPINRLIEEPFENWTRGSADLIGTVFLDFDFTLPVDRLRAEAERVVRSSRYWDGKTLAMHVAEATESAVRIRIIASSPSAPASWELCCEVREKLIAFVRARFPDALPKLRNDQKVVTHWKESIPPGAELER